MPIDALTMLFMTLGIAAVAAVFLAVEWRALRNPALLFWSAGFATIVLGCSISPLRATSFLLGVWFANGLLVCAHLLFLAGATRFAGRRTGPLPWALLLPWGALLLLPETIDRTPAFAVANAGLVATASLATAHRLLSRAQAFPDRTSASDALGAVFLVHGGFYVLKAGLALVPGAFVSLVGFKGVMIQISLFEGVLVVVLLALLMAASARRRREEEMAALAERDPLTGAFNRRAFESRADAALRGAGTRPGALLLLDIDRFKGVNDGFGHLVGDRLLVALTGVLSETLPRAAVLGRLGGDEFAILVPDVAPRDVQDLGDAVRARFAARGAAMPDCPVRASVSIGAALFATGALARASGLAALVACADAALYEAKSRGRDRLCPRDFGPLAPDDLSRGIVPQAGRRSDPREASGPLPRTCERA